MDYRKISLFGLVLILSIGVSIGLIWHGLNLDLNDLSKKHVLGTSSPQDLSKINDSSSSAQIANTVKVTKVFDGDTIEVEINGGRQSVRLIGIDTPETIDPRRPVGCFGKNASDETKRLLEGQKVILTKDVSEADKYNRLLRYVFLPLGEGENLFINDYLVRQGFAKNLTYPPDVKYSERFLNAEKEARENLRGLWSECK